jgi:hypothetical protein
MHLSTTSNRDLTGTAYKPYKWPTHPTDTATLARCIGTCCSLPLCLLSQQVLHSTWLTALARCIGAAAF